TMTPNEAARHGLEVNRDGVRRSAYELLAYPGVDVAWLARISSQFAAIDVKTAERLETEAKYSVYLDRQQADVTQIR
ncbi:MAG: tRNA uridine-5-carboxymethylaminomethyl(34) synthesis enzyme MnmG, partial [Mesorhizobium sp.]